MRFYEEVLFEYPSLIKRQTWKKDVVYKVRVLRKKDHNGKIITCVDIREYIMNERKFRFEEWGIYFTKEELDKIIPILVEVRKGLSDGRWNRGRSKDTRSAPKERKLL